MDTVFISGRFVHKETQRPIEGPVEIIPSRMWIEDEEGTAWATLAPSCITQAGKFRLAVTACRKVNGVYGWFYQIRCPMGIWTFRPDGEAGSEIQLKDLLPMRRT